MADHQSKNGLRLHWKSLMACTLITMSPFQYGVDFTLIGGFQAMVGFLKVIPASYDFHPPFFVQWGSDWSYSIIIGIWGASSEYFPRMEYSS